MNKEKENKYEKEMTVWLKNVRKDRSYSAEQFDKLIVYLSGGALVLTVGFTKDIVKINENTNTILLITSWTLFVSSLLLMLLSHKTSIIAMDCELNGKEKRSDNWDIVTEILNWTSTLSLFAGIITFIIFTYKHL